MNKKMDLKYQSDDISPDTFDNDYFLIQHEFQETKNLIFSQKK
jgi:hypothetical protein